MRATATLLSVFLLLLSLLAVPGFAQGNDEDWGADSSQGELPWGAGDKDDEGEGDEGSDDEGDEGSDDEGDEGSDDEGDEGSDDEGDEGSDDEGDEGSDDEGDEGSDDEGDEGSDDEGDEGSDDENDEGSDDENDEGSDDEGDEGSDDGDDNEGDEGSDDGDDNDGDDGSGDDGDEGSDDGDDNDGDDGSDDDGDEGSDDGDDNDGDTGSDDGDDNEGDEGSDDEGDDGNDEGSEDEGDDNENDELTVGFDDDSIDVDEDDEHVQVTVELSGEATELVLVDYVTVSGTATAGEDFLTTSGTLVFDGSDDEQTIEIPIFEDGLEEGNESFQVILSNPTGGAVLDDGDSVAEVVILDNDGAFACVPDDDTLCLQEGRFRVEVTWAAPNGLAGDGLVQPMSDTTGLFWFFGEDNFEVMLKILDGCTAEGLEAYWVFFAATTNLEIGVKITDTVTGKVKEYLNPQGQAAEPVQDLSTFDDCP